MNCGNCSKMQRETNGLAVPACFTKQGCYLRDVAPDRRLNAKVNAFLQVEMLSLSGPGYSAVIDKHVEDTGLIDESAATLLAAKVMLRDYQDSKSEEKARIAKARG